MSANDSSLPTHEECALAVFSFDSDDRLALLWHLGEDHLFDRAELELGRILAFYVTSTPRRLQVGLRDFRLLSTSSIGYSEAIYLMTTRLSALAAATLMTEVAIAAMAPCETPLENVEYR